MARGRYEQWLGTVRQQHQGAAVESSPLGDQRPWCAYTLEYRGIRHTADRWADVADDLIEAVGTARVGGKQKPHEEAAIGDVLHQAKDVEPRQRAVQ